MEIYPDYPEDTIQHTRNLLPTNSGPSQSLAVFERVIRTTLAPPSKNEILQACKITSKIYPDWKNSISSLENELEQCELANLEKENHGKKKYPMYHALLKLFKQLGGDADNELLVYFHELTAFEPNQSNFRPPTYYQHITALRDVMLLINRYGLLPKVQHSSSAEVRKMLSKRFEQSNASLYVKKLDQKLDFFLKRHAGSISCGTAEFKNAGLRRLKNRSLPDDENDSDIPNWMSSIDCNEGELRFRPDKNLKNPNDRAHESKSILQGFGRTNIRTRADMAACSITTYVGYLRFAQNADKGSFALIWLAALAGINLEREMTISDDPSQPIQSGKIFIERHFIRYQIFRRPIKDADGHWESAGEMTLPIPRTIEEALRDICARDKQQEVFTAANALAKKYSKRHSGLTPTLQRLRASARIHFAPRVFVELEFSALQGKIPPALKAVSHYYPIQLQTIQKKFFQAYGKISSELSIFQNLPLTTSTSQKRSVLFCKPTDNRNLVEHLFDRLIADIQTLHRELSNNRLITLNQLCRYLNLIEAVKYICQGFGLGLRPVGEKARLQISSFGVISLDKSSRLFQERSFTPRTVTYEKIVALASDTERLVKDASERCFESYVSEENIGDLAGIIEQKPGGLERKRMTNDQFVKLMQRSYPDIKVTRNNWIRKTFALEIHGNLPQWQIDELMAHRRVGREPLSTYSTAGPACFEKSVSFLDSIHANLRPLLKIERLAIEKKVLRV